MEKVAFVIGHNSRNKGAYSNFLASNEYDTWNCFYDTYLTHLGDKFVHNFSRSYTQRQKSMSKKTAGYELVIELHFNSSASSANGVECLVYYSNKRMVKLGNMYCNLMEKRLGLKNRGAKKVTGGNGFGFLSLTRKNAILLEPFFGSNFSDCQKYEDYKHAQIIEEIIKNFYNK